MSDLNSNPSKERIVVRWGILVILATAPTGLGIYEYFHFSSNDVNGSEKVMSGFGEVTLGNPQRFDFTGSLYTNSDLKFQILKPNGWEINSASEQFSPQNMESLKSRGFLDGIFLEENHNRHFTLTVFDVKSDDFTLDSYIDSQISQIDSQTQFDVPVRYVSSTNDWGIFALYVPSFEKKYGEQILFFKEGRLFMLQYSGDPPDKLTLEKKSEILSIIDSFEVI